MEKGKVFNFITGALIFLALLLITESHIIRPANALPIAPRPLCASQFSLANYACSLLPFSRRPPPSHTHPEDEGHGRHHRQGHGHRHRHRHHLTPQEENCCRWAKEVDDQCVCEILVRLPPFLMRPVHQYRVIVGESCDITYSCGGLI